MKLPVRYSKMTPSERREIREEYIKRQEGKCFYCHNLLSDPPPDFVMEYDVNWTLFPPNFLKHPVHLQHNHYTDMTEGAVHSRCNAVMWQKDGR